MAWGLFQRVRSWWQNDRIRASPREGRLLRLEAGDLVSFRGREYAISSRTINGSANGTQVHWTCEAVGVAAVMELQISSRGDLIGIWWNEGNARQRCDPWELEVWPRRRMV